MNHMCVPCCTKMLNLKLDNKDANHKSYNKYIASIYIFQFTEQDLRLYIKNFSSCPEIEKVSSHVL